MEPIQIIIVILLIITVVLLFALIFKKNTSSNELKRESDDTRRMLSDEMSKSRREQLETFQSLSKGIFDRWGQRSIEEQKRDEAIAVRISNLAKDNEIQHDTP